MKKSPSGRNSSTTVSQDEDQDWMDSPKLEADELPDEDVLFDEEAEADDDEDEAGEASIEYVEHMDIREPVEMLRELLAAKVDQPLDNYVFWLQNTNTLEPHKNLVDQCIQGEGLVQINCQINHKEQIITIVDILKPTDDVLATSSSSDSPDEPKKGGSGGGGVKRSHDGSAINKSAQSAMATTGKNKNWAIDNAFKREQIRRRIPDNPLLWTKPQVRFWLQWAMRQFSEASISPEDWNINGEQLARISLEQFNERVPHDPGNVFWTHLELLRKCKYVAVQHKNAPTLPMLQFGAGTAVRREKVVAAAAAGDDQLDLKPMNVMPRTGRSSGGGGGVATVPMEQSSPTNRSTNNGQIQLWQFLLDILTDVEHRDVIQWEGDNGQFKLLDAERVARLWGIRKNKPNMNYEKLSRALRYYYDGDMLAKVTGKRFVYQFVCNLEMLVGYSARELAMLVNEQS